MVKCTAFVLGGGGSRGALQVGALRAFLEAGIVPDLLVGASIGAVNATGIALWGFSREGLNKLEQGWAKVANSQLLDTRISQLIIRAFLGRPSDRARRKTEEFFLSLGISKEITFGMIDQVRLAMVSADIETGQPIIFGGDPNSSILEGILTSIALPPWFPPFSREGRILVDGGALSNVPIEPALNLGATEIYAFDLNECAIKHEENLSVSQYLKKYITAVSRRMVALEAACAEQQGVPVHRLSFPGLASMPIYDFGHYQQLFEAGYWRAKWQLAEWETLFSQQVFHHPVVTGSERCTI